MCRTGFIAGIGAGLVLVSVATAQVTVWVDFTSDIHNGIGGGANGTADWIDELGKATTSAGVTAFSPAERTAIQTEILSQLGTIYSAYDVTFTTTVPTSGVFDAIAYGKTSFGFSSLGIAPSDPANIASSQVAAVATGNFDFILDEFTGSASRPTQLAQISTALAGTGAHELGHTFGLFHHQAYSDPSITPATYGATGGAQNKYIMATGPTGLDELGRETLRSFSPWEKAMLDLGGGAAAAFPGFDHKKLVSAPVPIFLLEDGPFDAGATPPTSVPIPLAPGETSGMKLALIAGDLDGSPTDMDMYKLVVTEPSLLCAEVFSDNRFAAPFNFDSILVLTDAGGAPLAINDDVFYDSDVFGAITFQQDDSFLLNIPVSPGVYHLLIHASPTSSIPPGVGDAYWLAVGLSAVPEPSSLSVLALAAALALRRARRGLAKSR
ncbi:hypothetical protein BH09PLA1_BH09PLA1_31250 [soil metagenome]